MDNIIPLQFENHSIRVVTKHGNPWFVAKDIALVLSYANPQKAVRDHCKHPYSVRVNDSFTLYEGTVIIPESDIYRLVMRSKLPEAERFADWVMEEVLPSIRKTGSYRADQEVPVITVAQMKQITQGFANFSRYFKHFGQRASNRLHRKLKAQFEIPSWEQLPTTELNAVLREIKEMEHMAKGMWEITGGIEITFIANAISKCENDRVYSTIPDEFKALVDGNVKVLGQDGLISA